MKNFTRIVCLVLLCSVLFANRSSAQLNTYRFEQVDSLLKMEKRKVMVFIYTDWCRFCQAMKNTTFKIDAIIRKLNKEFYVVYLNAEEKRNIRFNGNVFKYKPTGVDVGINELAEKLGTEKNTISYPTLCFLNEKLEVIFRYTQFASSAKLAQILSGLQ